jgi:hypothetical protein
MKSKNLNHGRHRAHGKNAKTENEIESEKSKFDLTLEQKVTKATKGSRNSITGGQRSTLTRCFSRRCLRLISYLRYLCKGNEGKTDFENWQHKAQISGFLRYLCLLLFKVFLDVGRKSVNSRHLCVDNKPGTSYPTRSAAVICPRPSSI